MQRYMWRMLQRMPPSHLGTSTWPRSSSCYVWPCAHSFCDPVLVKIRAHAPHQGPPSPAPGHSKALLTLTLRLRRFFLQDPNPEHPSRGESQWQWKGRPNGKPALEKSNMKKRAPKYPQAAHTPCADMERTVGVEGCLFMLAWHQFS